MADYTLVHQDANGGNVANLTGVTWGTGGAATASGDVAILSWTVSTTHDEVPSGDTWTQIGSTVDDSSCRNKIFKRICDGTESGDITLNLPLGASRQTACLTVWRGASDVDQQASAVRVGAGTTTDCPSITTGVADALVLIFYADRVTSTVVTTPPSGYTVRSEFSTGGSAGTTTQIASDTTLTGISRASGTNVDPSTWTGAVSSDASVARTISLAPTSSGTPASVSPPAGAITITGGGNVKTPPTRTDHVAALTYPQLIAHRGGNPGPENTMTAFLAAAAISPDILLEPDVRVLSDGGLGLCHNDSIDSMASASSPFTTGLVSSFTSAQWATILFHENDGTGPDSLASFWHELVTEWAGTDRILIPEAKTTTAGSSLTRTILDEGMQGQVIVQSFTLSTITDAAAAGLYAIHLDNTPDIPGLDAAGVMGVGIDYATLTGATGPTIVADAHAAGMIVATYTVNTVSNRDTAIAAGADLIFTNEPALLLLSANVAPPAGAVTITGTAPTVLSAVGASVNAPAGGVTIDGTAPVVTGSSGSAANVNPAAGALTITGTAPTVSVGTGATITPTAGALTINATAPTATGGTGLNVAPPAGLLVLVGTAPSISSGSSVDIQPPAGLITIAATAPAITAAANVAATAGLLALIGTAPTVTGAVNIAPAAGVLVLAGAAPVVTTVTGIDITATGALTTSPWSGAIDAQPRWRGTLIDPPT